MFSKSSSFSQLSYSTVNFFYYTKYFVTPFNFLLFSTLSTFYFLTSSISIGFTSSTFWPSIYSLYYTTELTFTTRWILIEVGNHILITLIETTLSMMYELTYWSTCYKLKSLELDKRTNSCIRVNIRELNRELFTK